MFEKSQAKEKSIEPLQAIDQWSLRWLNSVPFKQRTVTELAEHFTWPIEWAKEVFARLTTWKLIK